MAIQLAARDAWLIALLAASDLSDKAKLVGARLALYLNLKDGRCDPSKATLAAALGLGVRTVDRAVHGLIAAGWLRIEASHGRRTHNYVLLRPPFSQPQEPRQSYGGVEGSNPAKSGISTPSELWRGNIEENITPLTPHGSARGDRSKGHPGGIAVAQSNPDWPRLVEALRQRKRLPSWLPPIVTVNVGRGPEPGWYFDVDLVRPRAELRVVGGREPP